MFTTTILKIKNINNKSILFSMDNIAIVIVQCFEELYVHQRSDDKETFPGLYGLGAGGKVRDGEAPMLAAKRELKEELGIEETVQRLFDFIFTRGHYRVNVYRTMLDDKSKKIIPSTKEFKWAGWMKVPEIDKELLAKDKFCPDTRIVYERFKREFLSI